MGVGGNFLKQDLKERPGKGQNEAAGQQGG